eukprot:tig00021687_g23126.t1
MDGPAVAEGAAVISAGRIDAVLHSAGLAPALLAVHPLPPEVALPHPSDHFPVMADYDLLKAELVRPPAGDARPAHPPPLFAPHLLEKEKLPAFRKAVEDRLQALESDLEKALGAAGTEQERRDRLVMSKKVERLIAGWTVEAPGGLPSAPLVARIEKLEALIKGLVPGPEPMPRRPVRDADDEAPFPGRYVAWRLYFRSLNAWRNRVRRRHQHETRAEKQRQIQEFVTARQARFADPRKLRSYLDSILERSRGEPIMHVTRLAREGNFYEIYTAPRR